MSEGEGRDLGSFLFDPATNEAIRDALPEFVIVFLEIITRLGDGATLVAVAMLLYWFGAEQDRHKRAMVLAVAVATLALVAGLKGILEVRRPLFAAAAAGEPLAFAPEFYEGYSTPSAHSMGAAAVYGALAVVMDTGKRWQRYLVAGVLIVTVPLSRVVIGVHYLGDVISGALLGLLLVAIALRVTRESITPMFGLSFGIAVAAFLLGSSEFVAMSIGASLGGLLVWPYIEDIDADPMGASILMLGIIVVPLFLLVRLVDALVSIGISIEIAGLGAVPLASIGSTIGYAILFGTALAVPVLASKLDDTEAVHRLQTVLPFSGRTVEPDALGEEPDAAD